MEQERLETPQSLFNDAITFFDITEECVDKVISCLNRAIELDNTFMKAYLLRAKAYLKKRKIIEAENDLYEVAKLGIGNNDENLYDFWYKEAKLIIKEMKQL
jgi:hypothetical protein